MRYAIIENEKVVNIVVATPEYAAEMGWIECPEGVDIGWTYENNSAIPPPRDIEAEWAVVRATRNNLLSESDVYLLPDRWAAMTEEQQQAWLDYRQALRDIPQTFQDPLEVIWPEKP